MYLHIKDGKAEVIEPSTLHSEAEAHKDPMYCTAIVDRIKDEMNGWIEYKHLYEVTKEAGHKLACEQEFQHMLLAISDLMTTLASKHTLTEQERMEMRRLLESLGSLKASV